MPKPIDDIALAVARTPPEPLPERSETAATDDGD